MTAPIRVAVAGTSWWADAMYLPALDAHPNAEIVGIAGRRIEPATQIAARWKIAEAYDSVLAMIEDTQPDAMIIATSNDSHLELGLAAIDAGCHLLCEKPMGRNGTEARQLANAAATADLITMCPFTYRWMPTNMATKRLIDDGYLGRPLHLNLRYFTGFALDGEYAWRFDRERAGSGILGDIGSHWLHLARWFYGEVNTISATTRALVPREPRPDGTVYQPNEDSAVMTLGFESGAYGLLQVSAVCWEGTDFGQLHEFDLHGDDGTLHVTNDWHRTQSVKGVKRGEQGPAAELPIPADLLEGVRTTTLHDTYRDVFRSTGAMTRGWIDAIIAGRKVQPDLAEGARVSELVDAALVSAQSGGVEIDVTVT